MGLKPRGFWHIALMTIGGICGTIAWGVAGIWLSNLTEEHTGRSIDSYGLLFFVPYFVTMFASVAVGSWIGNILAVGRRLPFSIGNREQLLIHTSRIELIGALIFAASFFVCPLVVLAIGEADAVSQIFLCVVAPWIGSLLLYAMSPHKLLSSQPQVIIDNQGITNSHWKTPFVSWDEIDRVRLVYRWRAGQIVVIDLKDTQRYSDYLPWFSLKGNSAVGGLPLNLIGLDRSSEEVWQFLATLEVARSKMVSEV